MDPTQKIACFVVDAAYERIIYHKPETGLQGKFSMLYILARALVHGKLTLEHFTDEAVREGGLRSELEQINAPKSHSPAFFVDTTILDEIKKSGFLDRLYK